MPRGEWFDIQVLLEVPGSEPAPGRNVIVAPGHGLRALADVIDQAYGRWGGEWDRAFMNLAEGEVTVPGPFAETERDPNFEELVAADVFVSGHLFTYVCSNGVSWVHECRVGRFMANPRTYWPSGRLPRNPLVVHGWGTLPDPYGRVTEFEDEESLEALVPDQESKITDEHHRMLAIYCEKKVPERVRNELRLEYESTATTLVLVERRPPWNPKTPDAEWITHEIAQFTLQPDASWTLQCQFSDLRWHEYEAKPSSPELAILLAEVDEDPTGIFWG